MNLNLMFGSVAIVATAAIVYKIISTAEGAGGAVADVVDKVKTAVSDAVDSVVTAVNPTDPDNLANKAANMVTRAATGDPATSFSTWLLDKVGVGSAAGAAAIAPSNAGYVPFAFGGFTSGIDEDAGAPAPGMGSTQFVSNAGGAATGLLRMKR